MSLVVLHIQWEHGREEKYHALKYKWVVQPIDWAILFIAQGVLVEEQTHSWK